MNIRLTEKRDIRALLDIFNYEVEYATSTFSIRPKSLEEWLEWFHAHNKEYHPILTAEKDGNVVGYASLSTYRLQDAYKRTAELSVYVDHHYRGQRIGEALMREVLDMARKQEQIHTVVSVITSQNTASIHLHRKLGFIYCGTLKEVGKKFDKWLDVEQYELLL